MAEKTEKAESKRARVRRLLISPLMRDGMRFRHGTPDDAQKKALDGLADDLAYMTDRGLEALRIWALRNGEGSSKCFWPTRVSMIGKAEDFERRDLEELPALARWFASTAGQAALDGGRLAAEYAFWTRYKRPPVKPEDRKRVADRAAEWTVKAERIRDRVSRGLQPLHDDADWLNWYDRTTKRAAELVSKEVLA